MALDEIPLAYLPGGVVRLHVKVVGDLQIAAPPTKQWAPQNESDLQKPHQPAEQQQDAQQHQRSPQQQPRAPGTPQQQTNPGKILDVPDSASPIADNHQPRHPPYETQHPDPPEPQHRGPLEPDHQNPSDPHHPDPPRVQPDPYEAHHQDPSQPHPDLCEPCHPEPLIPHQPESSSQQPHNIVLAAPGHKTAGSLQIRNVTSAVPLEPSSADPGPHHPNPSDTHQPPLSDPCQPNLSGSQHHLTCITCPHSFWR